MLEVLLVVRGRQVVKPFRRRAGRRHRDLPALAPYDAGDLVRTAARGEGAE